MGPAPWDAPVGGHIMHRHGRYDLWLHDDDELAAVLGSPVRERVTLHEWSLSCVQRVRTADGARRIYKVQAPPTLEPEVYARARSPLLLAARVLPSAGSTVAMVMEDVEAPRLLDMPRDKSETVAVARELVGQIAGIGGDPPGMADIRGEAAWREFFGQALHDLRSLVARGGFDVAFEMVDQIEQVAYGRPVLEAVGEPGGFVHGDLLGDNVLVRADGGLVVLDWQRPLHGPRDLDAAVLLDSLGVDPLAYLPLGVVQLRGLLRIIWRTACATRWLPGPASNRRLTEAAKLLLALARE